MNHLTYSQLNEYLDDALSAEEHRTLESHLEACPECRAELRALQAVFAELSGLPERELSRDLSAAVLAALPGRTAPSLGWRLALAIQAGAALGVLIVVSRALVDRIDPAGAADGFAHLLLTGWALAMPALPRIVAPTLTIPDLALPAVPFQGEASELSLLAIAAAVLWIVGNAALMRDRAGEPRR